MASEKFCLRWNDFESNISTAFRELREEKDFFDVTLACDDNQVQAHKVILSACSPFFRSILRRNPHQHPLLYLKGVKYQELVSVLNFMYQGEVNVAQEELNSFLAVAEDLRVKGLTQNTQAGSKADSEARERPREPPERDPVPPPKKPRPAPALAPKAAPAPSYSAPAAYDDDIQEVAPVKSEPRDAAPAAAQYEPAQGGTVALDDYGDYGDPAYDDGQYGEEGYDSSYYDPATGQPMGGDGNKAAIDAKIARDPGTGLWSCTDCQFTSKHQTNLRNHIEVHHVQSEGYFCPVCSKICKTKNALYIHKSRNKH